MTKRKPDLKLVITGEDSCLPIAAKWKKKNLDSLETLKILSSQSNFQNVNKVSSGARQPCGSLAFTIQGVFQAWVPPCKRKYPGKQCPPFWNLGSLTEWPRCNPVILLEREEKFYYPFGPEHLTRQMVTDPILITWRVKCL